MAAMIANEEKRNRRAKVIKIEKFSGDTTEYLYWKKQMKRFLRRHDDYNDNDCIDAIRSNLAGKALALAKTSLLRDGCLKSIWRRLDEA